jgi:hypothetical protein
LSGSRPFTSNDDRKIRTRHGGIIYPSHSGLHAKE